ncbi:hypothetical protein ACFO1B_55200 [Dactylosporangium siamense]|uniref:FHA domain-containing protein n=1 Tax=Dactylosporangium siamense TaxID=685454 RepID=A0A919U8V1_9ACTN|nr:hypothetical protein [Dactylosporangium siamense]GIG43150.1 hypothetical protein Dsi01nite_011910 [Dactylosporangium siamense]
MRFEVSRVMDTIEQRLTTDVTLAQAVVDLADVARFVALDGGRPINLLRLGMVVDALSRYLIDAGAMLYPVVGREALSEAALTSKERMVLGRWADDGLIEVTPVVADRPVEIADFTGLPLIVVRDQPQFAARFPWLVDSPERVLRLTPRAGGAVLTPGGEPTPPKDGKERLVVKGTATLPIIPLEPADADAPATEAPEPAAADAAAPTSGSAASSTSGAADSSSTSSPSPASADISEISDPSEKAETVAASKPSPRPSPTASKPATPAAPAAAPQGGRPDGVQTFTARGSQRAGRTRVMRRRFTRADPSGVGSALMAREWRCKEPDCPAFGRFRRIGQPVPRMRAGVPACPRHGEALKDVGLRPAAFAVSVVVEDLARRRFVVGVDRAMVVGREPADPDDIAVGQWLHEAAAAWIAKEHLKLEVRDGRPVVTDTSENGTLIWKRSAPDIKEETERIYHKSYQLTGWDSVELYTGVELIVGDHRLQTIVGSEPASVLLDAPTVALRLVD